MERPSRGIRPLLLLLLCLVAFGVAPDALAQTFQVSSGQQLKTGRAYRYTCGSPLSLTSVMKDGQQLAVHYMNTDRSQVVIDAVNATQADMAVRLIKCVCFKPENGYYLLAFHKIQGWPSSSIGIASAADFIRENRNLCVP